jgi:hypothetical protein
MDGNVLVLRVEIRGSTVAHSRNTHHVQQTTTTTQQQLATRNEQQEGLQQIITHQNKIVMLI